MVIDDGNFSLPFPQRVFGGSRHINGEVVASFLVGVFGADIADVAFVVETAVGQADTGYGQIANLLRRFFRNNFRQLEQLHF